MWAPARQGSNSALAFQYDLLRLACQGRTPDRWTYPPGSPCPDLPLPSDLRSIPGPSAPRKVTLPRSPASRLRPAHRHRPMAHAAPSG